MKTSTILMLASLMTTAAYSQEQTPDKRLEHAAKSIQAMQSSVRTKPIPPMPSK